MSWALRVSGRDLDIEALLSGLSLSAHDKWLKGERRSMRSYADSGTTFAVSEADLQRLTSKSRMRLSFWRASSHHCKNRGVPYYASGREVEAYLFTNTGG